MKNKIIHFLKKSLNHWRIRKEASNEVSMWEIQNTSKITNFFASAWVATGLAILAPIIGFWLGMNPQGIRVSIIAKLKSLMSYCPTLQKYLQSFEIFGLARDASIFVLLFIIFSLVYVFHKSAESKKGAKKHNQLGKEIQISATLGMGPIAESFQEAVINCYGQVLWAAFDEKSEKEELIKGVKLILKYIGKVTKDFDSAMPSIAYELSIFIFHPKNEILKLSNDQRRDLFAKKALPELNFDLDKLQGVLELCSEMTVSTASEVSELVGIQHQMILPVLELDKINSTALNEYGTNKINSLPGAPYSAATKKFVVIKSRQELYAWCNNADYEEQLRLSIFKHFTSGDGKNIGSFCTVPITGSNQQLLGVVSISRPTEEILPGQRSQIYMELITPLRIFLAEIIESYLEKGFHKLESRC